MRVEMAVETVAETGRQHRYGDDQRLVRNPYVRVVFCGNDEVLIKHGGRSRYSQVLQDEGRSGLLGRVLRGFAGPSSVTELAAAGDYAPEALESVRDLVDYLVDRQVLITPDAYLPHAYLRMHFGDGAAALGQRSIGLVGAGPLGSRIAYDLARLRPRALTVLDDRPLTDADLMGFDAPVPPGSVGQASAGVLAGGLAARMESAARLDNAEGAPAVTVTAAEGAADDEAALTELFASVDIVVVALESYSPQVLHAANAVALAMEKPWLSVFSDGSQAFVGPVYVPGETPCYAEFELQSEATVALRDDFLVYKETVVADGWHTGAHLLTPYLSIMSGWATTALLNFVLGAQPFAVARSVWIDFERLSVDYTDVLKLPRCPACLQQQTGYPRHLFL